MGKRKQDKLASIKSEHLDCRALQHAWRYTTVQHIKAEGHYRQGLQCSRCGTNKTLFIDYGGEYCKSARYEYPEGYVIPNMGALDKPDRGHIRIMAMNKHRS